MAFPYLANGNISPARFVKNSSADGKVVQAGAGEVCCGISQQGTRRPPGTPADDGYAAIAGEPLQVHQFGEDGVPLTIGGTVARGDRLKSDASGRGVTAAATDAAFAIALISSSVTGALIPVRVIHDTIGAA